MSLKIKIKDFNKDSLAKEIGLQINDVIVSYNGVGDFTDIHSVTNAVKSFENLSEDVELVIERAGNFETKRVKPGSLGVILVTQYQQDKSKRSISTDKSSKAPIKKKTNDNISKVTKDYSSGYRIASIATFFGWLTSAVCILLMLAGIFDGEYVAIYTGAIGILTGLFLVMGAQATQAIMDNANNTKMILEELRDK